jgi:diguanylate cyclase (GGDEF)-like protein
VRRYVETSADLAAAIGAQSDLSASDFVALTANLNRTRLPGISGTSLVVAGTRRQIPQLQREWRARGNRQLTLAPAGTADEHLFSVLNHSLDGSPPQTGRDLSQAVQPTQAMSASRSRGRVTASETYVLLKDRGLPASEQQLSFVLAAPVYGGVGTTHEGRFQGWLLIGMRGRDFISETIQRASQDSVAVTLVDDSTPAAAAAPVARVSPGTVVGGARLRREVAIHVAGRRWQLQVQPTAGFLDDAGPSLSTTAGTAGAIVTILLAVLVGTLSTSRSRALTRVESATTALRADITRRELVEAALLEREEELHVLALTDPLTGLANRRAFMDQLDQSHARALRQNSPVCVLFCDVDHFKAVNDTYGHAAGDAVLVEVADRLRGHFRTEDTIGRLGGDEFAVICENGSAFTEVLLDRVRETLAAPYTGLGEPIVATVSVGMASPQHGESSRALLERADSTMYLAKAAQHLIG